MCSYLTRPSFADIINEQPHEVQKAECTITAGDVKASAEAITTKTLKGVCGSAEMNLALHNLEIKLYKELQEIKKMLMQLKTRNEDDSDRASTGITSTTSTTTANPIQLKELKSKESKDNRKSESREWEVRKLNNTLLTDGEDMRIFSYYWKLENFSSKITTLEEQDEESYIFTILGKPLRIKASFNHMKRNFLYLKLESAKFDLRDKFQSIVMDTSNGGGVSGKTTLFKEIPEAEHFIHKISILDQVGWLIVSLRHCILRLFLCYYANNILISHIFLRSFMLSILNFGVWFPFFISHKSKFILFAILFKFYKLIWYMWALLLLSPVLSPVKILTLTIFQSSVSFFNTISRIFYS